MKTVKYIFNLVTALKILPSRIFILNEKMVAYVDVTKKTNRILLGAFILVFLLGYFMATLSYETTYHKCETTTTLNIESKHDYAVGDIEWKDSTFKEYQNKADVYLDQSIFTGTPINGEILSLAARNAYDSTGILLPLELALSQAQWESNMGRAGRSPEKNPYNVGEYDTGTVLYFESTFDGVQAYYYLMCVNYLSCKSLNELFINYTNCAGSRYASKSTYEITVKSQYYHIQNWINKNYVYVPDHKIDKNSKALNIYEKYKYKPIENNKTYFKQN